MGLDTYNEFCGNRKVTGCYRMVKPDESFCKPCRREQKRKRKEDKETKLNAKPAVAGMCPICALKLGQMGEGTHVYEDGICKLKFHHSDR